MLISPRIAVCALSVCSPLLLVGVAEAQSGFGGQEVITTAAIRARSVYATDLDGDGDADVLSASHADDKIAWYENLGGGAFGAGQVISSAASGAAWVYATDLDGDGDADVLSASELDNKIAWYENLGGGAFGVQQVITNLADGAISVYATDLDGDGDADVLSASPWDDKIAWYENLGGGAFGAQQVITTAADKAWSVYATDLDGDGDADVLSASVDDHKIAWYENLGGGAFGAQQVIPGAGSLGLSVYATDLDGDGDADVLSGFGWRIAWYENLGGGVFGAQQVITTAVSVAYSVYATDLDGDGDADVLSASQYDDKIAWYENLGGGAFGAQQVITTDAEQGRCVYATDLDGDGDADVLSASDLDNKIAWYENQIADCDGNGVHDPYDIAAGTALDCNANGLIDSCEITTDPALDLDLNGILDSCEVSGPYWFRSPVTLGLYTVLPPTTWVDAGAQATNLGGTLVTVRSSAENDWIQGVLPGDRFWVGYQDSVVEGAFEWQSLETPGYENWAPGAPGAFAPDQDYAALNPTTGTWDTWFSNTGFRAVVESGAGDCDGNLVPDDLQLQNDPSIDCDSNGLIDSCEIDLDSNLDCNDNGILDLCEVLPPALDMNGDGLLDACIPPTFCTGASNSSGLGGSIMALGSPELGLNNLTLQATQLPSFQWSYFLMSQNQTNVPGFGGSQGVLCVGAPIVRFNMPGTGQINQTSAAGERSYTLDFTNLPQAIVFQPGDTWNFQLWFRDVNPSLTSNTTDGVTVMFR